LAARLDFLSRGEQNGGWDTIKIFGGGAQDAIQRPHPTLLPVLNTAPAFSNKKAAARFNRFSHRTRGRQRDFQLENGPSSQSPEDKMKQKAEGFRETPGCFRNFKWIGALVAVLLFILPANPFVIIRAGSGGAFSTGRTVPKENVTPQLIKLRQIEASKEAIKKWDGHLPRFAGGNALPFIGLKYLDEK
jgi:hypothetical protein